MMLLKKIKGPKGSSSFNSEKVDGTVKLFLLWGYC
jgi:hypothetical protein